jgi:hypothetical protein
MSDEPPPEPAIIKLLPYTRFYPQYHLATWHPRGVFDEKLADRVVEFSEMEERESQAPFDRFADLGLLSEITLSFDHLFGVAQHRRHAYAGEPFKMAICSEEMAGFAIARMYEALMEGSKIEVRAFLTRESAAHWLGVPVEILLPREDPHDPR